MPRRPKPERLTIRQARARLKELMHELTELGGATDMTNGQLRHRALLIRNEIQRLLDRFPTGK